MHQSPDETKSRGWPEPEENSNCLSRTIESVATPRLWPNMPLNSSPVARFAAFINRSVSLFSWRILKSPCKRSISSVNWRCPLDSSSSFSVSTRGSLTSARSSLSFASSSSRLIEDASRFLLNVAVSCSEHFFNYSFKVSTGRPRAWWTFASTGCTAWLNITDVYPTPHEPTDIMMHVTIWRIN